MDVGPDTDDDPTRARAPIAERVSTGPSRGTGPLVAVLVALVLVAIVKPWDLFVGASGGGLEYLVPVTRATSPAASSPAHESARSTASPRAALDPNATSCMSASGERLVTLIRTPEQDVRSWQLLGAAEGHDALQPGLVPVQIPSVHVVGLGLCADQPDQGSDARAAAEILDVILVDPANGGIEDLGRPPIVSDGNQPDDAVLYGPPAPLRIGPTGTFLAPAATDGVVFGPGPRLASWATGSYGAAFRYADDPAGLVRWIRFDVVAAPGIFG